MKYRIAVTHEFVELIPSNRQDGVVYVSMKYATVVHNCCCGCGNKVVTPLSPTDWKLIYDGRSISLDPSIGNWSFPCKSHYWITQNQVHWDRQWSRKEIDAARTQDLMAKQRYFNDTMRHAESRRNSEVDESAEGHTKERFLRKLWNRLF